MGALGPESFLMRIMKSFAGFDAGVDCEGSGVGDC